MEEDFVGAIKIKDGLFIGDAYAAQDFEFVVTNKVTHIINCAGEQIFNYWESVGVAYLTYDWMDSENQIVFDAKGEIVNEIYNFIEEAVKLGEGVLVYSLKGQSRSCCVLTAYFMKRYRWSLYKTLEFLTSRRPDLEIRTSFYHQLLNLESRLFQQVEGNVTVNWFEVGQENDTEELLLRNTFLNARSAPFDEALVNPKFVPDTRPRKLGWGDERSNGKTGIAALLTKEAAQARLSKSMVSSFKSILKGSNKVFKLKAKTMEDEISSSSSNNGKISPSPGLRMNKSVKNFSEVRAESNGDATPKQITDKSDLSNDKFDIKNGKSSTMMRSSSATYFDREENLKASSNKTASTSANKLPNAKVSNVNGNIIHLTVNNYLAPVNNLNAVNDKDPKAKQSVAAQSQLPRPSSVKPQEDRKKEIGYESNKNYSESSYSNLDSAQQQDRTPLSTTNQLKYAIEKKLSKEYKSQLSSTSSMGKPDIQVGSTKTPSSKTIPDAKPVKMEIHKPNDLKVNYQVLLKNRETPPPRKREDGKKIPESPLRKANSKSNLSNSKGPGDSSLPYSSYLNSLFSTSFSHLNTVTPSAYSSNYVQSDKKTPISAKSTPLSYNLTLSQKAQTLTRPQRIGSSQGDKNYDSNGLTSSMVKQKFMYNVDPPSTTNTSSKYNNYLSQAKSNPVRVTYEKIDRPHSATPDRSATPQSGLKRAGTPATTGGRSSNTPDQRLSVPTKTPTSKHVKKDSGSTQDLLAKYRQRSSSPSQYTGYTPSLSSSMGMKSKAKY